jgi:hydrogenase nickel incorporation protein HypA/HybF
VHELALCQEILAIAEAEVRRRRFTRVRAVRLEVGAFACASPDAIAFCFDAVTRETLADGAALEVVRIPGEGVCLNCGERVVGVADRAHPCPACGHAALAVQGGDGLRVTELEVE